jgi:hypothetical protein
MIEEPRLGHLISMMTYLNVDDFIIPDFNIRLPIEALADNFRPERIFKLHRRNGSITYYGSGSFNKDDIVIRGIQINDVWIARAYSFLADAIRERIKEKIKDECIPELGKLLLKFNYIDFVEM